MVVRAHENKSRLVLDTETEVAKDPIASVPAFPSVTQEVADLTLLTPCRLSGRKFHFADEENTVWVVTDKIRGSRNRDVPSRGENLRIPVFFFHLCFLPKARVPRQVLLDVGTPRGSHGKAGCSTFPRLKGGTTRPL